MIDNQVKDDSINIVDALKEIEVQKQKDDIRLKAFIISSIFIYAIGTVFFIMFLFLSFANFAGSVDSGNQIARHQMEVYSNYATIIFITKAAILLLSVIIAKITWPKNELSKKFLIGYIMFILLKPVFFVVNTVIFLVIATAAG